MRLTDLRDNQVRTLDGETLGRVHEVHCDGGRIFALMCGARSIIERLTARSHGRRIPWEDVVRIDQHGVVIASKKANAARTPRGTPPSTGRRSKR